jgi:peptide/nickel transport system permease protein
MVRLVLKRIPQAVIVVIGVSFLTFSIMFVLPGDVVHSILGDNYTPAAAAALNAQLHLNQPFFLRYFTWLGDFFTGNVGLSLVPPRQPVWTLVGKSLLPTSEMLLIGQVIAILLGVLLAVASVASRSRIVDRVVQALGLVCSSIPGFVLGLLLLTLLAVNLHIVSPQGWVAPSAGGWGQNLAHILFPSIVLALFTFPVIMRVFRAELVDQLDNEDYVLLARLKGISGRRVIFRHVLRNSSFGLLTVVGINVARLIGGVIIIEQIFGIPGMGTLIKNSVVQHDTPTALAALTIVAIFVVVVNLVIDIAYALLDPRVRDQAA